MLRLPGDNESHFSGGLAMTGVKLLIMFVCVQALIIYLAAQGIWWGLTTTYHFVVAHPIATIGYVVGAFIVCRIDPREFRVASIAKVLVVAIPITVAVCVLGFRCTN